MKKILAINPGATSTKYAVFEGEKVLLKAVSEHQGNELQNFARVFDQYQYRLDLVVRALEEADIALHSLDAVVGRGGLLKPLTGGTYAVNEQMVEDLKKAEQGEHASNLGAVMAYDLAQRLSIPAFIVDPVSVDEMIPEARLSGLEELPRISMSHALNSKAVARKVAAQLGQKYEEVRLIVVHLGTGVSVTPHAGGRMLDVNNAQEEGPFSPDRCGGLPVKALVKLCYTGKYSEREMLGRIMGCGGMYSYLGTRDVREATERAEAGDKQADLVLKAMAHQVAKEIGAMSTVLAGKVDRIVLTGGIAYSRRIVGDITERVEFIAPVTVVPGEEELESLAEGALRVLQGEESAKRYI